MGELSFLLSKILLQEMDFEEIIGEGMIEKEREIIIIKRKVGTCDN
jgi:hypothetical protein